MTLVIDTAEPVEIEKLVSACVSVARGSLNQNKMGDYFWSGVDGKTRQVCRVQAGELLGNVDSQEAELRRYYNNADETYLFIEGIVCQNSLVKRQSGGRGWVGKPGVGAGASKSGKSGARKSSSDSLSTRLFDDGTPGTFTHRVSDSGYIITAHKFHVQYSMYAAWKWRLTQVGIGVLETVNYVETAQLLVAAYKSCQKSEHHVLTRYIGQKVRIPDYNPHVVTLMGIEGAGLGEEKAKILIKEYGSVFNLLTASTDDVCSIKGFGKTSVEKIWKAIGRE